MGRNGRIETQNQAFVECVHSAGFIIAWKQHVGSAVVREDGSTFAALDFRTTCVLRKI